MGLLRICEKYISNYGVLNYKWPYCFILFMWKYIYIYVIHVKKQNKIKNMRIFLICFIFLSLFSIQKIDSILTFRHFNIGILNHLGGNKKLMFNCREKGGSTAVEFLPFNTSFTIKFVVYPKTLIWCNLWKVI